MVIDHNVDDSDPSYADWPYSVHYNRGFIFDNWVYCKSFKTGREALTFIDNRKDAQVDDWGKKVVYFE